MEKIIQEFSGKWISKIGVVAIAEGIYDNKICIHMYISKEFSLENSFIPDHYKGIKVIVEVTDLLESL